MLLDWQRLRISELGRRLSMSYPGVGYAVSNGERIAKQNNYQLADWITYLFPSVGSKTFAFRRIALARVLR